MQSAEDSRSPLSLGPTTTSQANGAGANQTGLVNSAAGAAGALAGWALSSLSKQLAATEVHSSLSAQPASNAALAAPSASASQFATPTSSTPTSPRASSDSSSVFGAAAPASRPSALGSKPAFGRTSSAGSSGAGGGGLKLGGVKKADPKKNSLAETLAGEWEDGEGVENAWGNDDLMDVNADGDDWGKWLHRL